MSVSIKTLVLMLRCLDAGGILVAISLHFVLAYCCYDRCFIDRNAGHGLLLSGSSRPLIVSFLISRGSPWIGIETCRL